MACREAPVAKRAYVDARAKWGSRVYFLGIVGDQNHQGSYSGHNCGRWAEAHRYPQYGPYDGISALAVDIGVGNDVALGNAIRDYMLTDSRVLYVIYRGIGYRPYWRGGGTWVASGHMTHVHTSFTARDTNNAAAFYGSKPPTIPGRPPPTPKPPSTTLNIGGFTVADMTKDEFLQEMRNITTRDAMLTSKVARDQDARIVKALALQSKSLLKEMSQICGKALTDKQVDEIADRIAVELPEPEPVDIDTLLDEMGKRLDTEAG